MQYKPKLHFGRWVEEHFNGNMYKKPLYFVDLWLMVLWVSGTCKYSLTSLASSTPCSVWPAYCSLSRSSISFYYISSLWVLSWIPLLLGEMSPVLKPILRDLRYIKQRMVVGSPQKEKKNPSGNYLSDLLGFLMILETRTI